MIENIYSNFRGVIIIIIPVLFAAMGGLFPVIAGILNIALEGMLLSSAFTAISVFYFTQSVSLSIFCAIISSIILSLFHAFAIFKLQANAFITGLALNIFSAGFCVVLSDKIFKTRGVISAANISINPYWFLISALIFLILSWIVINKTVFGYRLRSCEKNSDVLVSLGINVNFYQASALVISAFFCAIGGSFLSLILGSFVQGMSAGKGWIALVIIFLGGRRLYGILAAVVIYGMAESLSNYAQGYFHLPGDFFLAFPYLCTLIALIAASVIQTYSKNRKI